MLLNPRPVRQKKEDWVKLLEKQGVTASSDISEEALQDQYVKYFLVLPSLEEKCVALVECETHIGSADIESILKHCIQGVKAEDQSVLVEALAEKNIKRLLSKP